MKIAFAAVVTVIMLIGGVGQAVVKAIFGSSTQPSQEAIADIPADYLALYRAAAAVCPGLDWSILAAIGKIESDHGRSRLIGIAEGTENSFGARGPMQFLQSTFDGVVARHPIPPGGKNPPSPWDKHDAIYAAAYYLCESGAPRDIRKALFAYNHADWYVNEVLDQAKKYSQAAVGTGRCDDIQTPNAATATAINFACGQLGLPYLWGGNGPELTELPNGQTQVRGGFDCSGLTKAAYAAAGIQIPRTAQTQYNAGPRSPAGQPVLPGDLVFFGSGPKAVTHVGIAISAEEMVDAPDKGLVVRIERIWRSNFVGSTRPAANQPG